MRDACADDVTTLCPDSKMQLRGTVASVKCLLDKFEGASAVCQASFAPVLVLLLLPLVVVVVLMLLRACCGKMPLLSGGEPASGCCLGGVAARMALRGVCQCGACLCARNTRARAAPRRPSRPAPLTHHAAPNLHAHTNTTAPPPPTAVPPLRTS